ncbi:MAG: glycosyltransferase family 2 protein [Microbacterium sp.]|uniref:glycosyltransferase family 2 protein n=1 Tax=Microbacterium sp. TaxID=51671 RepID=UPI001AC0EA21|nr:glycosyltransferase family A protein [Microbacterium sp.]MBN9174605.1 glycosyltransferase family 2 protein [Microbacterium sp.]
MGPQATVILPAKDAADYIGTTLATLARQFDEPSALKVVVVDDGSTDDTAAVVRHFASRFDRFELLTNPRPVGLASARNQGLPHIEGDYFCFIDGDDWMQPGRVAALVSSMRHLGCDFVRTDHVTSTEGRRQLVRAPYPWRGVVASPRDAILPDDDTTMVDYPYAWAGMFHRKLVDKGLIGFPEGLFTAEDRPWIWRLHLRAKSFAVVDAPAILYRRGVPPSLTQITDERQLDFLPAFAEAVAVVEGDAESARFLPKIVATTLAVCAHHLHRSGRMSAPVRRRLRTGVGELLAAMPGPEVDAALRAMPDRRRHRLAGILRGVR